MVPEALEADLDASTIGQASPIAGVPVPAEDSAGRTPGLTLAATGEQTATTTLSIATQDAGNVGQATYRVKRTVSGVADAGWRGADLPNVLTGFEGVGWSSSARQTHPHAVTLPDDTQVVVYAERPTVLDSFSIKVRVWSPTTETYSSAVTVVSGLDSSHVPHPWLLVMPDPQNRNGDPVVLLGHWDADDANNAANINLYISRDGGATWSGYAKAVLENAIDLNVVSPTYYYDLGRVRCAMVGSQIVMFMHLSQQTGAAIEEQVYQYASASAGALFVSVGEVNGASTSAQGWPDVATVGNAAVVLWTAGTGMVTALIRNAFVLVATYTNLLANTAAVSAGVITFAAFSICAVSSTQIAVIYINVSGTLRRGKSALYDPYQDSLIGLVNGWIYDGKSTSTEYVQQPAATLYRNQLRVYCNPVSSTATYENKLTRLNVGGLTTVTMPSSTRAANPNVSSWIGWEQTYMPTALPSVYAGWARTTTGGSDDITTTAGRHRITTAASTRYYTYNPATALTATSQQMMAGWRIWQVSGGSVSAREIVVGLRFGIAGTGYDVECRCSATQIRTFDVNAGATLNTATVAVSAGVDILMALSGTGKVSVWYRPIGTDEDRNFLELETQTSCTDDAGVGGTVGVYKYGSISTSTATAEYIPFGQRELSTLGINDWATTFTNPDTLRGIPYGTGTYALAGVKLTAMGGPTLAGDAWTVSPDATYPYRHLLPVGDPDSAANVQGGHRPSAREAASGWRSTATSGYLAFRYRGARNRFVSPLLLVHEEGLNVPSYAVEGYNEDAAAWAAIGTATKYKTVAYTRPNATSPYLRVDTGNPSTDEPYLYEGELAGGWVKFVTSGDIRPIVWNGEGRWSSDDTHGLPYILLDPDSIDGTETGTGDIEIWYPRSTFGAYLLPTVKYSKFALRWSSAQSTYTGDIRANIVAIGYGMPLVRTRDRGTIVTVSNPSDLTTVRSGLRFGVQREVYPRRTLTVPLIGVQEQDALLDATTTGYTSRPFKLSSSSSMAYAGTVGDGYGKLCGAWVRAMGSRDPVVYVPRLARGTPDTFTLLGQELVGHYSRITSEPRFTDRYGVETGAAYGAAYVGENVVFEGEL